MQNPRYQIGDTIVLKRGTFGNFGPSGAGRIVSRLPEADGATQYRVQFEGENFERRVVQPDIDVEASTSKARNIGFAAESKSSSWINATMITLRKR
ncbi:cold-shock protein [Rhizobium sp. BK491]|uniref:cold-shock protein n=1 Tax=Rhizobium sp. BK491 TaxID=2587009 RepID=UPI00161AEFE1|nr:cold-shock protein [Rhizobium sp. BK491]MBB3569180.1 hypothetical protein [Rhizobium sp. BK491]